MLSADNYLEAQAYYAARQRRFSGSAERCGWLSPFTQSLRFQAITQGCDLSSSKILDVGCGYGDFLSFLAQDYEDITYTGLDFLPQFLSEASTAHPTGLFIESDFFRYEAAPNTYDYVFAVGPFNHRVDDNYDYLKTAMSKMFAMAKVSAGVSLLSNLSPIELRRAKELFYYDPAKVLNIALEITPFVELKTNYLPNDMGIILYH